MSFCQYSIILVQYEPVFVIRHYKRVSRIMLVAQCSPSYRRFTLSISPPGHSVQSNLSFFRLKDRVADEKLSGYNLDISKSEGWSWMRQTHWRIKRYQPALVCTRLCTWSYVFTSQMNSGLLHVYYLHCLNIKVRIHSSNLSKNKKCSWLTYKQTERKNYYKYGRASKCKKPDYRQNNASRRSLSHCITKSDNWDQH